MDSRDKLKKQPKTARNIIIIIVLVLVVAIIVFANIARHISLGCAPSLGCAEPNAVCGCGIMTLWDAIVDAIVYLFNPLK